LLFSDMVMPGGNGLELYAALHEYQPPAELLIMAGYPATPCSLINS
jgi:YesN/AraC family two-component response regulator